MPPLVPHNPLSILQIAYVYLSQTLSPPPRKQYDCYFSAQTSSFHVTDPKTIRALWEMGFFGKGSLSRSEPSWLDREKKRLGLIKASSAEEVTAKRRQERREWKLERARLERELIEERLKADAAKKDGVTTQASSISNAPASEKDTSESTVTQSHSIEAGDGLADQPEKQSVQISEVAQIIEDAAVAEDEDVEVKDQEHLQLSLEEVFFLAYGLGVLRVFDDDHQTVLSTQALLQRVRQYSYFPPQLSAALQPDDPFLISYAVYHHYRSLGWVVRSGIKFSVDFLLYNRGPVFSHAEFALMIVPSYHDTYWSETEERRQYVAQKQDQDWWWFHCVNRVQAQVRKSLVLCYVEIPPPAAVANLDSVDIGKMFGQYRVRDFMIKRWVANRSRD